MTITYHPHVDQGSAEWLALRCGMLTASSMNLILTPKLMPAANDKERQHVFELLGQRITKYVEPRFISDDMLRGMDDESRARDKYAENFAPVEECGFITNDELGFPVGFSPDGLVRDNGFIEVKSRLQKFQVRTLIEREMPVDYALQVQTGLWVSDRKWCDFISYCGGMPMCVVRVWPDEQVIKAIKNAAEAFEERVLTRWAEYDAALAAVPRLVKTERHIEQEMFT